MSKKAFIVASTIAMLAVVVFFTAQVLTLPSASAQFSLDIEYVSPQNITYLNSQPKLVVFFNEMSGFFPAPQPSFQQTMEAWYSLDGQEKLSLPLSYQGYTQGMPSVSVNWYRYLGVADFPFLSVGKHTVTVYGEFHGYYYQQDNYAAATMNFAIANSTLEPTPTQSPTPSPNPPFSSSPTPVQSPNPTHSSSPTQHPSTEPTQSSTPTTHGNQTLDLTPIILAAVVVVAVALAALVYLKRGRKP